MHALLMLSVKRLGLVVTASFQLGCAARLLALLNRLVSVGVALAAAVEELVAVAGLGVVVVHLYRRPTRALVRRRTARLT